MVSVLNFFRENETVYMVMNYLEGGTLQDFIITARELKKQKVFASPPSARCLTRSCVACVSCTSTRCCTWTSSPPTSL